jgi:hypothetical protein
MPLPNGVDPFGRIASTCPSAGLMGNRGVLHESDGAIVRPFKHQHWVACEMSFKGRNLKPLMQPNRYSELFFLDEATALAAGHRPCGECRRADHVRFKTAWMTAFGETMPTGAVKDIDRALHAARIGAGREKQTYHERLAALPDGVIIDVGGVPYLYWKNVLHAWSPSGYTPATGNQPAEVTVLTPQPVVAVLRAGYVPRVHASVD